MRENAMSTKKLPYKLSGSSKITTSIPNDLIILRNNCINSLNSSSSKADSITCIDTWLKYTEGLLTHRYEANNDAALIEEEIALALINVAVFYQDIGIETLYRAYESSQASNNLWTTSGTYLKRGLGLICFLGKNFQINTANDCQKMQVLNVLNLLSLEFQLLQQLGIVVLALSKLRSKISKDAVADLEPQELEELGKSSVFYAKLCIGSYSTASQCQGGRIVDALFMNYLQSLTYLFLSINQYNIDECGIAIGMLQESIKKLLNIVPNSQLKELDILSSTDITKKRDLIKMSFKRKIHGSTLKNQRIFEKKVPFSSKAYMMPLLKSSLDDFVIPLTILLRYRYQTTNENYSFKTVETDVSKLKELFPRGKSSDIEGTVWSFQDGHLTFADSNNATHNCGNYF
ncbi:BCN_G0022610.mRNA.1.CDS.1 [Saccharomyces cerevisiae]|nr:BCN_G0022610.mRNA.1.CDS.1 [Saccharomyces cerevisiae]CAI4474761.1 BCE_3a_G0022470.mRNA.1.CDS.1 [Saccharomyces cerevisiae]CAI7119282.1 BCN_G0022610.mRNA.1.CDS.1 [Saccharomyces cerevisiae]CAI7119741.1 BCE_3a_G0022470.mRNA.1.CDS.1 [Saccharomyces cerevisiae]